MVLRFLLEDAAANTPPHVGETITLTGAEAHHAVQVRRVRVGEQVGVGDGRGTTWFGAVSSAAPRHLQIVVERAETAQPPTPRIVLVQALAKGDRDELAVQAATELGIDEVIPWQASRSVSRWDAAKAVKGVARWQSITREAAKQAHRAFVPSVSMPVTTSELAARCSQVRAIVLEPTAQDALSALRIPDGDTRDILLIVGPEGGISTEELETFTASGATLARLGADVLRTSTAGPAAIAVLAVALGRW